MPDSSTLLVFSVAALALILVPGPNVLYIVTGSISQGRRAGFVSALGIDTGTLVHVAAAALGLSALLASSALALNAVKYVGAGYLILLGIRTLLGHHDAGFDGPRAERRLSRIYLRGVLVNALNPKVALFFLAFLPQFVDPGKGSVTTQIVILGSIFFLLGVLTDTLYAFAAGLLGGWLLRRPGFARRQRHVSGVVYLALGALAAFTHVDRAKIQPR
ncbi:MAG: LysE family translocator [Thermomicrobiales bacterium]